MHRTPPAVLDPSILVPPSFAHLAEVPALATALQRTVEACLQSRARFPHTLLVGPADASKRSIAAVIAAEMAVPISFIDLTLVAAPDDLHAALKDVPIGGVVVASGFDAVHPNIVRDIARAVSQRRPAVAAASRPQLPWDLDPALGRPARAPKPYAEFTMIGTAREPLEGVGRFMGWVEQQFHLRRSPASEAARLGRAFARFGLAVDAAGCRAMAERVVGLGIRTLPAVGAVVEWMRAEGLSSIEWSSLEKMLPVLLEYQADPACVNASPAPSPELGELPAAAELPAPASRRSSKSRRDPSN